MLDVTLRRSAPFGLAIAGFVGLFIRHRNRQPKNVVWVQGSLPLLGSAVQVLRALFSNRLLDWYDECYKKLGKTFAYNASGTYFVATIDPQVIEYMLKTNFDNYIKGWLFRDPFTDLLGDGIFNADGALWHQQRKTSSRLFSKKQFESHIWETVQRGTEKVIRILSSNPGETIDMFGLLNRFTLDTIGQIGFSKSVGSLDDPSSPFLRSFDLAQRYLIIRFWTSPLWKLFKLLRLGWEPELKKHLKLLHDYSDSIVSDLIAKVEDLELIEVLKEGQAAAYLGVAEAAETEDSSLVGLFLKDLSPAEREDPKTKMYLRDLVLNFLIAGRDTTAQCLAWTVFELTQHPEVVKKARVEIEDVFRKGPLTYASLKDLRYLKAVIDEGLRLHPSVPYDGKLCVRDDVLPNGTKVPAGTVVQFTPYAQGRCTDLWGADAEKFRPERWLEMDARPSDFTYSAFNAGPRVCLGRSLAELEMTAFLATVLRTFDFELQVEPHTIQYDVQLTLGMTGLPVKVTPVSA